MINCPSCGQPVNSRRAQVIAAFDAGERNCAELGRRFSLSRTAIRKHLLRAGRKPMTRHESIKAQWALGKYKRNGRPRLPFTSDPHYQKLRAVLGAPAARAEMKRSRSVATAPAPQVEQSDIREG